MEYYLDITSLVLPNEIWVPIKGFEGLYEVSSLGRIKSLARMVNRDVKGAYRAKEKIRKQIKEEYLKIGLHDIRKNLIHKKVHRVVAEAFIPKIDGKTHVNHIDGNRYNNAKGNLEWCTHEENMAHAYANNLIPKASGEKHYKSKLVLDLQTGIYYNSGGEAARAKGYRYEWLGARLLGVCINKTSLIYV